MEFEEDTGIDLVDRLTAGGIFVFVYSCNDI